MKEKRKYGQYFTKRVVAEYMVGMITKSPSCKVLEPSCGEGVFLKELERKGFCNRVGYEIDPGLAKGVAGVNYRSFLSVPTDEKYDVVIGNPPYIRWRNLEAELKEELAGNSIWNGYFNSLCDYLFIFILKSVEHLNEGGELIFICSDYWMNSTHAATLRNYMVAHGHFEIIYHFKEATLFDGVNASFVIFRYRKTTKNTNASIELLTYAGKSAPTMETLADGNSYERQSIPQFKPGERWLLAPQAVQDELRWFESVCVRPSSGLFGKELCRIGDVCDIGNGMVSGLDAAFRISEEEVCRLTCEEMQSTIEVLKAKNLGQYRSEATSRYIHVQSEMREEDFENRYPHFAQQLEPHRGMLDRRYSYGKDLPYWMFAFPRNKSLFDRKEAKIFVPCKERISHKHYVRFCYAPAGVYPLQDVTAIVKKPSCKESIEYLLAFLNSRYVFDWLRFNGIVKGEIVEFSEAPVASIPYRRIDWSNPDEVRSHNEITDYVRDYVERGKQPALEHINESIKRLTHGEYRLHEIA